MAINPISFAGAAAGETSFEQKLQKPQAYQAAGKPVAAAQINSNEKNDSGIGKKVAAAIATAVVAAVVLAKTHNSSILADAEGTGKLAKAGNFVKGGLRSAGQFIDEKSTQAYNAVKNFCGLGKKEATATEKAVENEIAAEAAKVTGQEAAPVV